ncbi:MAG: nitroreductase family protein, partial [Bacteroidota bacterium]
ASAMVQNLLLLLTAHGMGTYWSSGGAMREAGFYQEIGIPESERFLAAVFVEYPETLDNDWDRLPGKHRERRSDRWIREVAL